MRLAPHHTVHESALRSFICMYIWAKEKLNRGKAFLANYGFIVLLEMIIDYVHTQ